MTEQEWWLVCSHPGLMLSRLPKKTSNRKLRLFACACCRGIWQLLTDERSREAVEAAERFADGLIRKKELKVALAAASRMPNGPMSEEETAAYAVARLAVPYAGGAAESVLEVVVHVGLTPKERQQSEKYRDLDLRYMEPEPARALYQAIWGRRCRECSDLLREVIGNPFRPLTLDPAWSTPAVVQLARSLYEEQRFEDMPVLADALEEAGCQDAAVLGHCRGPGPHVRGCWVRFVGYQYHQFRWR